jgi:endonuclease/exonuclease/phosphatase (EEP) superfamily protein YafD
MCGEILVTSGNEVEAGSKVEFVAKRSRSEPTEAPPAQRPEADRARSFKILTYNVWFDELCRVARMDALGDIITQHSPDVVVLQEVTQEVEALFRQAPWFTLYESPRQPFTTWLAVSASLR